MKTQSLLYFFVFLFSFFFSSRAQNLITNAGFESGTRAYATAISTSMQGLRGLWKFDNSAAPLVATVGPNLTLSGTHTTIAGYSGTDNAVRIGTGSNYSVTHGIPGNGGSGTYVNNYSLLVDFRIAALGDWKTFLQTNQTNSNDADLWVRDTDGMIGVGAVGYSAEGAIPSVWHRLVVSVSNGSFFRIYMDGRLICNGASQVVNGRFSLDPKIYFMADDNGEDGLMDVSTIALFDKALSQTEVESLGRWTCDNWLNMGNFQQQARLGGYASAFAGNYYLFAGSDTPLDSYQDVNVSADAVAIDAGAAAYTFSGKIQTFSQSPQDQGRIIVEYRNAVGTVLSSYDTGNQSTSSGWVNFSDTRTAPALTRTIRIRLLHTKNNGTTCDAFYDDFSLTKLISLGLHDIVLYDPVMEDSHCGLQWKFGGTGTLSYFEVERSTDFDHWETTISLGYKAGCDVYAWTDDAISGPVYYYRIKGIDSTAQVMYSKVQSVNTGLTSNDELSIRIQNPAHALEELRLYTGHSGCDVYVYDAEGKLIHQALALAADHTTLGFTSVGVYTVLVRHGQKSAFLKMVII